jgi:hypothetical protein
MHNQTQRLRNIDLKLVLARIQATAHPYDRAKWYTCRGSLSVNGQKFFNWSTDSGGGGAIDLMMHLRQCDFKTATAWLQQNFPDTSPQLCPPSITHTRLALPQRDDHHLQRLISYLNIDRRIPLAIIQNLIDSNCLYADTKANAVFLLLGKEKKIVGAEIRGTSHIRWLGMAKGSRKDIGCFYVKNPNPQKMILCESAIDALSFFSMNPQWLCVSTSGATPHPAWLPLFIAKGFDIHCGFDADQTGDSLANKMISLFPSIKRLRPIQHDWNDQLHSLPMSF